MHRIVHGAEKDRPDFRNVGQLKVAENHVSFILRGCVHQRQIFGKGAAAAAETFKVLASVSWC